jgi:hypothetical protein
LPIHDFNSGILEAEGPRFPGVRSAARHAPGIGEIGEGLKGCRRKIAYVADVFLYGEPVRDT